MTETKEEIKIEMKMKEIVQEFMKKPEELIFFRMVGDGQFYIANKNHKRARGMIAFPEEICSNNLKTLNDWFIVSVAIPKEKMNKYIYKKLEEKRNEKM